MNDFKNMEFCKKVKPTLHAVGFLYINDNYAVVTEGSAFLVCVGVAFVHVRGEVDVGEGQKPAAGSGKDQQIPS